jgi:hypothetical protein
MFLGNCPAMLQRDVTCNLLSSAGNSLATSLLLHFLLAVSEYFVVRGAMTDGALGTPYTLLVLSFGERMPNTVTKEIYKGSSMHFCNKYNML